jgi:hypothetical protein
MGGLPNRLDRSSGQLTGHSARAVGVTCSSDSQHPEPAESFVNLKKVVDAQERSASGNHLLQENQMARTRNQLLNGLWVRSKKKAICANVESAA